MAYFTRAEVSLDLGCLGQVDVIVIYHHPDHDPYPTTLDQVFLQSGRDLHDILPLMSVDVREAVLDALRSSPCLPLEGASAAEGANGAGAETTPDPDEDFPNEETLSAGADLQKILNDFNKGASHD